MGIFGFSGERWSHVTSSMPLVTSILQRLQGRRLVKYVYLEEKDWHLIEEKVQTHRVTAALRKIGTWVRRVRKAEEEEGKEGTSQMFQNYHILKSTRHFIRVLERLSGHINKIPNDLLRARVHKLFQVYLPEIFKELKETEASETQDEKTLYALINDAAEKRTGSFVDNWRTAFKKKGGMNYLTRVLERRGLSVDIRTEYHNRKGLERISGVLEEVDTMLEKKPNEENIRRAVNRLEGLLKEAKEDIPEMFNAAHRVLKRDLLLMVTLLGDEKMFEIVGPKWIQAHFMPEIPIQKAIKDVRELERKLSDKAHDLANALNVIIKSLRSAEDEVRALEQQAA